MVVAAASVVCEPWPATLQVWSHIWKSLGFKGQSANVHYTYSVSGFEPAPKNFGMRTLAGLQHPGSPAVRAGHLVCLVGRAVELG